jgi:hypothetical protein
MIYTHAKDIPVEVRRMAAAVHEAGHAVVAVLLGRKVTRAMLRLNGLSGQTEFESEPAIELDLNVQANRHVVEDAVVVLLAGEIAEAEYWAKLRSQYNPLIDTHYHDALEINRLTAAFHFSPEERTQYDNHCRDKTRTYVRNPSVQASIEEIAAKLAVELEVSRADMDKILERHELK